MARVVRKNKGVMVELMKRIKELDASKLQVGVFESAKYEDGTPVAGVAAVQELGSPKMGIPPRPFFRTTAEEKKGEWAELFERAARAIIDGTVTPDDALDSIGLQVAGQVRTTIGNIYEPALSPVTLHLRKLKQQGGEDFEVTGAMVNSAKQKAAKGEALDISGVSTKPLVEDGTMKESITHRVEKS